MNTIAACVSAPDVRWERREKKKQAERDRMNKSGSTLKWLLEMFRNRKAKQDASNSSN